MLHSPSRRRQFLWFLGGGVFTVCLILGLFSKSPAYATLPQTTPVAETPFKADFFHLIIPAGADGFCRTLFSAGALNYPIPRVVNWRKNYEDSSKLNNGYNLLKIEGALDYLHTLDGRYDNELVLIPDGSDTWFQLRPEVLITRYHALIKRLDERSSRRYNDTAYNQKVIFTAQNDCDSDQDSLACTMVPPSDSSDTTAKPRYLNSGSIMGTVRATKSLLEHAKSRMKREDATYTSDQQIFTEIYGDQEYYREMKLAEHSPSKADDPRQGKLPEQTIELECDKCQFGIGLDYRGELFMPAEVLEEDLLHVVTNPNFELPSDIAQSTPPFWTPDYSGETQLPWKEWAEVGLITHKESGIRPVAVQHDTNTDPIEAWRQNWNFPHLRTIATAQAKSARMPFAVIREDNGLVHEYWGPNDGAGGARCHRNKRHKADWKQWDELCSGLETGESIFQDGLGAFQNPIHYLYWDAEAQGRQLKLFAERRKGGKPS
ncbi:hypothetical protein MBLNU230_g4304t1 [Neophaeotheca triangularis]